MSSFNYDEWKKEYYGKRDMNLLELFTKDNIVTLNKLDIRIEDKKYTKHEYEIIKFKILCYYKKDNEDDIELESIKFLEDKNVNKNEFNSLIEMIEKIFEKYSI